MLNNGNTVMSLLCNINRKRTCNDINVYFV